MTTTLDVLLTALIKRLAGAGFDIPQDMPAEERTSFLVEALAEAAIVPADDYKRLIDAGHQVVGCWETGDLAGAVRKLAEALRTVEPDPKQSHSDVSADPNDQNKPTWRVDYTTTVHADSEEEAMVLAERDFADRNCVTAAERC